MTEQSDAELIVQSATTPEAFALVVRRHHALVYRYVARRLGAQQAEDLASEAFALAFAARGKYDVAYPSARPWLLGIATNLIRNHKRAEYAALKAYATTGRDPLTPTATTPTDDTIGPAVAAAMAAMKPKHRDVLFLHAVAELSHEEIAHAMGVPIGSVKGWLSRARATAQQELAKHGLRDPATPITDEVPET